mgnify:CR=1 FL=1
MDFPIVDLVGPGACYRSLLDLLHPDGLRCPRCHRADRLGVQARHRAPVPDYRCAHCGRVFGAYAGARLQGARRPPIQLVPVLRGIAQGTPTARLARAPGCDRLHLLGLVFFARGDRARAKEFLEKFLETRPEAEVALEVSGMLQVLGGEVVPFPGTEDN